MLMGGVICFSSACSLFGKPFSIFGIQIRLADTLGKTEILVSSVSSMFTPTNQNHSLKIGFIH